MYDFIKKVNIYNNAIEQNNMIYSIDMLRLKTYISYNVYNDLEFYLRAYYQKKVKRFWISDRPQCYHYNYNLEVGEGKSFWFGFFHNSEQKVSERFEPEYMLTIEFNPNKLRNDPLLMYILNLSGIWYITKYDLAIDLHISILDLIFDKSGKRTMKVVSKGLDDRTVYLGATVDKFVKIYNKKHESNLGAITGDLTRVEISREVDDFKINDIVIWSYDSYFPDLYLNNYVYSLSDTTRKEKDKTLYAMLFAVQNGYSLNDLTRQYRKRVKELLQGRL